MTNLLWALWAVALLAQAWIGFEIMRSHRRIKRLKVRR